MAPSLVSWTVLGSGTTVPHPSRGCASYLLSGTTDLALFDSGSGTKDRLARHGVRLGQLSNLVYSHGHLDHWADLLTLLFYRIYAPPQDRRPGLVIAGPRGFPDMVKDVARAAYPDLLEKNGDVVWQEILPGGPGLDGGWFHAQPHAVQHGSQEAQAWRVTGQNAIGKPVTVAYSGDASPCQGLIAAGRDADVFVCECAFPQSQGASAHMTPQGCRELAEVTRPRLLVLTHFYPEMEAEGVPGEAFEGYSGRVIAATDGLVLPLSG